MKILDRYIGRAVAGGILTVMSVLLALYTFFTFLNEAERVGEGNYTVLEAFRYVIFTLPRHVYELFPVTSLLGTMLGLGTLSAGSEITVIRAAGVSLARIGLAVMRVGVVLMVAAVVLGELVAPGAEQYAQRQRAIALQSQIALQTRYGFWARDGQSFINIRVIQPGGRLEQVSIYEFDDQRRLRGVTQAQKASYHDGHWLLEGIVTSLISDNGVTTRRIAQAQWESLLSPGLLSVVVVRPDILSAWGLYQYVRYLKENKLDAGRYQLALWSKLVDPFTTGVMVFLALPFVFGPLRSVSAGSRMVAGALVGISFHIFNQAFHYVGQVYNLNPPFSAIFPTALFLVVTVYWLRRVR